MERAQQGPAPADPSARVASWGFVSSVVSAGLSYVIQPVIGRLLSPGTYSEAQALLALYMMLAMPATPLVLIITRRVVQERERSERERSERPERSERSERSSVHALLRGLTARTAAIGALALAVSVAAARPLARALAVTDPHALPLLALAVVTSLLYLIAHATLLGRLHWRAAVALPVALGATRLAFSVLFVYAGWGAAGVCAGIAASTFGCFIVAYVLAAAGLPPPGRYRPLHLGEIGLTGAASAAFWFLVHIDTIYVNGQLPAMARAGYAAASTLARPLVYFPAAVNQVLFPFLAAAATRRARRKLLSQMLMTAAAIDLATLLVLAAAPRFILEATFGAAYGEASGMLTAIAVVLAPYSLVNIVFFDTLARNDRVLTWAIVAVAAAAGLILFIVPPSLGGLFAILVIAALAVVAAGIGRIWPTLFGAEEGAPR